MASGPQDQTVTVEIQPKNPVQSTINIAAFIIFIQGAIGIVAQFQVLEMFGLSPELYFRISTVISMLSALYVLYNRTFKVQSPTTLSDLGKSTS